MRPSRGRSRRYVAHNLDNPHRVAGSWATSTLADEGSGPVSAASSAQRSALPPGTQGTAVLVHGGWGNPSDWLWVQQPLEAGGIHVLAPDLPSHRSATAGLMDDSEAVREAIRASETPVVVVGWSYGGDVITAAADAEPDVAGLVYVSSVPRDEGFVQDDDWLDGNEHLIWFPDGTYALDNRWWLDDEAGATFPPEVRAVLRDHPRRPIAPSAMVNRQVGAAWHTIPAVVLMGRTDYFLTESDLTWMATQPTLDLRMLDCDHFVPFRQPQAVADAVLELLARPPGLSAAPRSDDRVQP
ncbi:alpha/beta fold hydrolase [Cellulomonas sp. P5_C6]